MTVSADPVSLLWSRSEIETCGARDRAARSLEHMNGRYILNDAGQPEPCEDLLTWGRWMEQGGRRTAYDEVGDVRISTVFLGLDHAFSLGDPVLWETMIFGGEHDQFQDRYTSRQAALEGHQKAVAMVKGVPT